MTTIDNSPFLEIKDLDFPISPSQRHQPEPGITEQPQNQEVALIERATQTSSRLHDDERNSINSNIIEEETARKWDRIDDDCAEIMRPKLGFITVVFFLDVGLFFMVVAIALGIVLEVHVFDWDKSTGRRFLFAIVSLSFISFLFNTMAFLYSKYQQKQFDESVRRHLGEQ